VNPQTDFVVLQRLLDARYSCRAFKSQAVPRETIEAWLRTAQRTASWCNTQPWQLVVTSGDGTTGFRDAMLKHIDRDVTQEQPDFPFPEEYRGACLARRRETGAQLYQSVGIARGDRAAVDRQMMENFRLFGAPHVAIITTDGALGVYGAVDTGLYVGTLLIAAQALGLACIAQASIARYPDFVRNHFGLPEDRRVVCAVSFGFADDEHPANGFRTTRAPIDDVVTWVGE
jgi:nitroreductase